MKIILIALAVLFALVLAYLPFAFYWLSFDPAVWGDNGRLAYVLVAMWSACALGSIAGMRK